MCETWLLPSENVHPLEAFADHCLRHLAKVGRSNRVRNLEVLKCVFEAN